MAVSIAPREHEGEAPVPTDRLVRLDERAKRERRAREEAERLLEAKSRELFDANTALASLAAGLEKRVEERRRELARERRRAIRLSEEDVLTGLANRAHFTRALDEAIAAPGAIVDGVALILIDLDGFKAINDSHGHPVGDEFLRIIARRMQQAVRAGDLVARLGGDEFAVLARDVDSRAATRVLAERVARAIGQPVQLGPRSLPSRCSTGTARFPDDATLADDLLRDADIALYQSKRQGRGEVMVFDAALRAEIDRRAQHEDEVRGAVERGEILPWLQPIYCCRTERFIGAEILARWHHPQRGMLAPDVFIDTVESLGLLDAMTESLARQAFRDCAGHLARGDLRYLALNLSPKQFATGWARDRLPAMIAAGEIPSSGVLVEITENALLQDVGAARSTVAMLSKAGVRLAIDDFGIGYSNFSLLRDLRVHVLKMDRSLSINMETDATARAIVECIVALAAKLDIVVIAEGVQTQAQARALRHAGCPAMQGFLLARPRRHLDGLFQATHKAG